MIFRREITLGSYTDSAAERNGSFQDRRTTANTKEFIINQPIQSRIIHIRFWVSIDWMTALSGGSIR
jgi:hypothetical protein